MKLCCAVLVAGAALALSVAVSVAPASAATVTDFITFSDTGSYPVNSPFGPNDVFYGYQPGTVVTGSFYITFDPTQLYLPGASISGVISDLKLSVNDPYFGGVITLNPITTFAFDGAGTLTLDSNFALSKAMTVTPDVTIGINGWAYGLESGVWYSQGTGDTGFGDTLTTSGTATITATPLPSTWTMLIAGLIGLGFVTHRSKKDSIALSAA